jgi:release factor H-coupled RctB family protein
VVHRKGPLRRQGAGDHPWLAGDFSYLVEPIVDGADHALHSLAHGAGRKWSRKDAHARLSRRFKVADMQRTALAAM